MAKAASIQIRHSTNSAVATATYLMPADGHWFSSNRAIIRVDLHPQSITLSLIATNIGRHEEPIGIGWHPYFRLPSGNRTNARLHVPATMRTAFNNPNDMIPTGDLLPIRGAPLDFTAPEGAALTAPVNDAFLDLKRSPHGYTICSIADTASDNGLRISALTPLVKTILVYAPAKQPLIVLEPQFNNGDPFGNEWRGKDNGMVTVQPGSSVVWKTQLTLFLPRND